MIKEKYYKFFWIFDPRFDLLLEHFLQYLEKQGYQNIEPIIIRAFPCNKTTCFKTFVLGHAPGQQIIQKDPEELNKIFSQWFNAPKNKSSHSFFQSVQDLHIISFTNQYLNAPQFIKIHGPSPSLIFEIDSKVTQFNMFKNLGIPFPPYRTCQNLGKVKQRINQILSDLGSFVILPENSAGGYKAKLIKKSEDIDSYQIFLKQVAPSDSDKRFLLSGYIESTRVPSCNALITKKGKVIIVAITELLFNGFRFSGAIYPVFFKTDIQKQIIDYTMRIGKYLVRKGYWGFYAADFLLDPRQRLFFTEVNPRYTFEAAFLFSVMKHNLFSIFNDEYDKQETYTQEPNFRTLMFKISPEEGKKYENPFVGSYSLDQFIAGKTDYFREYYWKNSVHIKYGTYLGLCGKRFPLHTSRADIIDFYLQERQEKDL